MNDWLHRRFREFVDLDAHIRFLCKTDILPTLPQDLKLITDHLSPDFIKARQTALDAYVKILSRLPYIEHINYFTYFVGLTDMRVELSIIFDEDKIDNVFEVRQNPGTDLATSTYFALVSNIKDKRKCFGLQLWDVVSSINGKDVENLHYLGNCFYYYTT